MEFTSLDAGVNEYYKNLIRMYADDAINLNKHNKSCHVAILLQGKHRVVSYGFNQMNRMCFRGKSVPSLHAEMDCLRKCRPIREVSSGKNKLLIAKLSKKNDGTTYYNSMPCKRCTEFIKGLNFKKVYCSDQNGDIVKIRLDNYVPYDQNI